MNKKNLLLMLFVLGGHELHIVAIELNPYLEPMVKSHGIPKDKKTGKEREHEAITIVSYANEPVYLGVFEKQTDVSAKPKVFGDIYTLSPGSDRSNNKPKIFRPTRAHNVDRLLYFTKDKNNFLDVDARDEFIAQSNCEMGRGCINVGEGVFSTRNAFIIYPIDDAGNPDLNGTKITAIEDSITNRSIINALKKLRE